MQRRSLIDDDTLTLWYEIDDFFFNIQKFNDLNDPKLLRNDKSIHQVSYLRSSAQSLLMDVKSFCYISAQIVHFWLPIGK